MSTITRRAALAALTGLGVLTMRSDDVAQLFTRKIREPGGVAQSAGVRQGLIVNWNPFDLSNVVRVGGTECHNVPVLNVAEASTYAPGDMVIILVFGQTLAIWGLMVIPGTPKAAEVVARLGQRIRANTVPNSANTTSTTFGDLSSGPVGPIVEQVPIGPTGACLITFSANMSPTTNDGGAMSCDITGATSRAASTIDALSRVQADASQLSIAPSRRSLVTGLNPGYHDFTAKYKSSFGAAFTVSARTMIIEPIG